MGKASSAKKVAKAARAGGRTSGVRQRNLLFPSIIVGIFVLGIGLITYARNEHQDTAVNVEPTAGVDHWHAAYGVYICGEWKDVAEYTESPKGIHSHQDELIHIHPNSRAGSGDNARMKVFFEEANLDVDSDKIELGDESWETGEDTCEVDGEEVDGEVVMAQWDDAQADSEPSLRTEIREERFTQDGEGFVFAFVPEGETDDIPKPPSVQELASVMGSEVTDRGGEVNPEDLPDGVSPEDIETGDGSGAGAQPPEAPQTPQAPQGQGPLAPEGSDDGAEAEDPNAEG